MLWLALIITADDVFELGSVFVSKLTFTRIDLLICIIYNILPAARHQIELGALGSCGLVITLVVLRVSVLVGGDVIKIGIMIDISVVICIYY